MSAVLAVEVLAKSGEAAKSGPIGLGVILLLCIACYFLFKSMSKHMRRVREQFPSDAPPAAAAPKVDLVKSVKSVEAKPESATDRPPTEHA